MIIPSRRNGFAARNWQLRMRYSCLNNLCLFVAAMLLSCASRDVVAQVTRFKVDSNVPNAEVWVNGIKVGETDADGRFEDTSITEGTWEIVVSKEGYKSVLGAERFTNGLDTRFVAELEPLISNLEALQNVQPVRVLLQSGMSSAQVFVDDMYMGYTDLNGQLVLTLPPGRRTFMVYDSVAGMRKISITLKRSLLTKKVRMAAGGVRI